MSEPLQPIEPPPPERAAFVGQAISRVQGEPVKSVASAFVVGLVLSLFPVGRLISFFLGLALTIARPLLLVLGSVKVFEEVSRRRK